MVMWKGGRIMNLPELTHEEEVDLERFTNLMVELIEKHADAVNKDELMAKINEAGNKKLASFFVKCHCNAFKWANKTFFSFRVQIIG